jgi:hypothetical protein
MNGRPWTSTDTRTLEILNGIGCDDALIAEQTGHCTETIQRHRAALGLPTAYRVRYDADIPKPSRAAIEAALKEPRNE